MKTGGWYEDGAEVRRRRLLPGKVWRPILLLLATMLLPLSPAYPEEKIVIGGPGGLSPTVESNKYPVTVALSGGGARGLAAIGIFKAFEEKGINVVAIAGTSMGGIIGGLYATGFSPDQLATIIRGTDFNRFLANSPRRGAMFLTQREERDRHLLSVRFEGFRPVIPRALSAGQELTLLLTTLTTRANYHSAGEFTKLPIPFKTVSTDMITGREIILERGSLANALRATMAFPLAFTGVEDNGRLLMDGGMVTPIPVELARAMCDTVNFVVAINTAGTLLPQEKLKTPIDIANQATTIMTAERLKQQLAQADYIVTPPLEGYYSSDFKQRDSLIEIGYRTGLRAADSIITALNRGRTEPLYRATIQSVDPPELNLDIPVKYRELKMYTRKQLIATLKQIYTDLNLFQLEAEIHPADSQVEEHPDSTSIRQVDIRLRGFPRSPMKDWRIGFVGNTVFDDSILTSRAFGQAEQFTPGVLKVGMLNLLQAYRSKGYDLIDIKCTNLDGTARRVTITIDEGIVDRIEIRGNHRTKDWFIRSLFPIEPGQPYSTARAARGIADIYGTDLFDRVTVDLVPHSGRAIVTVGVEEKKHRQMRLGWRWDDEYESEEFIEALDDNVLGMGIQFLLRARYAADRQAYLGSIKSDRIRSTYLTATMRFYHERLNRQLYDREDFAVGARKEERSGLSLKVGQQISRLGTVSAALVAEELWYRHGGGRAPERFDQRILEIVSLVENFDRVPFPQSGKKHLFETRFAGKFLGGDVDYTRFFSSIEAYWQIGPHLNYHPRLAVGLSRSVLPPSERFYLGGENSFAGYRTFQLSGAKLFTISNELRLKLPAQFYLTVRYDQGQVFESADQIVFKDIRQGVGFTVAYDSPVGPVKLGYGVAGKGTDELYVNIGLDF